MARPTDRIAALDGLRAISILLVISAHLLPLGPKHLQLNAAAGAMGMTLFFALSGFLITSNLVAGQNVLVFFVRRLARILPLAYLYLMFVFLIVQQDITRFFGNVFFVENYFHWLLTPWNAHFWSLCVEVHFYFAIGIAVALFGRRAIWSVLPACIAVTSLRILQSVFIDIRTHVRADEILAGASVAIAFHSGLLTARLKQRWLISAVGFWFLASWNTAGPLQYLRPYSSAILIAVVICCKSGAMIKALQSRLARYIASISYALYVVHPATIQGWMNEGSAAERYLLKRPVSLVLAFLLAHISTFYWENRFINWAKTLTRGAEPPKGSHREFTRS